MSDDDAEFEAQLVRATKALAVIPNAPDDWGTEGTTRCPNCGKWMRYRVAALNGHRRAKCETQDCVNFVE